MASVFFLSSHVSMLYMSFRSSFFLLCFNCVSVGCLCSSATSNYNPVHVFLFFAYALRRTRITVFVRTFVFLTESHSSQYHSCVRAPLIRCFYLDIESVYLDSNHQGWLKILVVSCFGVFENKNADAWTDFVTLLKFRGINMDKIGHANPIIVTVVTSIIEPLGEYPLRKELIGTPSRFVVKWLQ